MTQFEIKRGLETAAHTLTAIRDGTWWTTALPAEVHAMVLIELASVVSAIAAIDELRHQRNAATAEGLRRMPGGALSPQNQADFQTAVKLWFRRGRNQDAAAMLGEKIFGTNPSGPSAEELVV
jgi:hypothetical protein